MRRFVLLVLSCVCAAPALGDSTAERWNLANVYASIEAWNADAQRLEAQLKAFGGCKGRLGEGAARFRECLDLQADMTKRYYRLALYSGQLLAEDTGASASLELDQRADLLGNRLTEATAFMDPETLRLGRERIDAFLAQEPRLAIYRHPLDQVLRAAPHTLDAEGEALVASFGQMNDAGAAAYAILTNADLPWPTIRLSTGEEVRLDATAYTKHREAANREDRKRVMDAFFGAFRTYERSIGVLLYAQLKQDAVYARVRKYPDSLTRALDRNRVPRVVMDTLIAQTQASLPTLHRYFRLRARMLGVERLQYHDIYPPLVQGEFKYPYGRGRQILLEALSPLGAEYVDAMTAGLDSRWMDLYPRPRKQSGAHVAGYAYDVHPYVLMNYNADYESVTTLAHEWGHAMHSYFANRSQPFVTANYATFTAEIASTFNESLLLDHVLQTARSDDERLYFLGTALELLRGTFYRQAMFAEFERDIHARVDRGESLSGAAFSKAYCDLLRRYHGAEQGVVTIDDAYCVEWAYIPHFYRGFYVYQYATSVAASSLLAQRVKAGQPGALERYLGLLKAGGSDYPYDLVKQAGVDLATPAPYQALVARMNAIMDDIEALLARRK